jgi:NAD(P)-dependent dehydrogenase (short-subunit alcohol dehydrogenase family)
MNFQEEGGGDHIKRLEGQHALITGGTSGMGAATAMLFKAEGATVIVTGSNEQTLAAARRDMPGIEVIASDAGDPAAVRSLVNEVKQKYGYIDILFVNAGVAKPRPAQMVDEEFYDYHFDVNTRGAYFLIKEASQIMPDGGSIILTSSIAHFKGMAGQSVYSGSKAALRSFARTFAAELAPRNIRVNVISPGPIDTPILEKMGLPAEKLAAMQEHILASVPLKRKGRPEEIATVALFFASSDSSFITGVDLPVDGGMGQM